MCLHFAWLATELPRISSNVMGLTCTAGRGLMHYTAKGAYFLLCEVSEALVQIAIWPEWPAPYELHNASATFHIRCHCRPHQQNCMFSPYQVIGRSSAHSREDCIEEALHCIVLHRMYPTQYNNLEFTAPSSGTRSQHFVMGIMIGCIFSRKLLLSSYLRL